MEYNSKQERISTNPSFGASGNGLAKEKREEIENLIKMGVSNYAISEQTKVSRPVIIEIKKQMEDAGKFELGTWKKQTASLMSEIVSKGADRLLDEIDNIPAGQLPLAIAIMTDKVLSLQDAPTVIVEHRLRVSHDDINQMLKGDIIDITELKDK